MSILSPIKVVFIQQDGLFTGSAISLLNLIKGFNKSQVDCHIVFFNKGPAVEIFQQEHIKTSIVPTHGFWTTPGPKWFQRDNLGNLKALVPSITLRKHILSLQPDLVHINDKAALNAGLSLKGTLIPIVQHLRSTGYICRSPFNRWISTFLIERYADYKIAISEDEAYGFSPENTEIIFNSINLDDIKHALSNKLTLQNEKIHIGWLGRFSGSKGAWDFIKIASALNLLFPNLVFHMLAPLPVDSDVELIDGNIQQTGVYLNTLIQIYQLQNNLVLHGYRKDFLSVVAAMDLMINCNRLGALGRQAFETVCLGIPSITTVRYPGRSKVLNSQVSRIEKEGDLENIIKSASFLIKNERERMHMAKEASIWGMKNFDAVQQSLKVISLYNRFLSH